MMACFNWAIEQAYQQDKTVQSMPFAVISLSLADLWC